MDLIDDEQICPHQIALAADGAQNPYRKFILPLAYEQIGLLYAVLGITSFHLGTANEDSYLRDTLAVVYRTRAIRSLADTIEAGISGNIHENERDALFATIQLLLLQDVSTEMKGNGGKSPQEANCGIRSMNPGYPAMAYISPEQFPSASN